mgnify:CR=1 FL=1
MTTATRELDLVIADALSIIDRGLGDMSHRELVSTTEVSDLLLDLRMALTPAPDPSLISDN